MRMTGQELPIMATAVSGQTCESTPILEDEEEESLTLAEATRALLTPPQRPRQVVRIAPKGFRIRLNPE